MVWADYILFAIGLILLGWYQRYQIGLLKKEVVSQKELIESQKQILDSFRTYADVFDTQKLKEWVKIREETIELRKGKEVEKIKAEVEKVTQEKAGLEESFHQLSAMHSSERDDLVDRVEDSETDATQAKALFESCFKKLFNMTKIYFATLKLLNCLVTCMTSMMYLVMYADLGLASKLEDNPRVRDIYNELFELILIPWRATTTSSEEILSLIPQALEDPSVEIQIPEAMEHFDRNKFDMKVAEAEAKYVPIVASIIRKENDSSET